MRHYLAIFLLIFMPLQLGWAVVASYCQHESAGNSSVTAHLGHHQHQHQDQAEQTEQQVKLKLSADPDCAACHAAATPALLQLSEFHFQHPARTKHHDYAWPQHPAPKQTIDRPQWSVAA